MKWLFLSIVLFSFSLQAEVNYEDIDKALKSDPGLVAEIHGADKDSEMFVVVVRNPDNFFDYLQVPIVADYLRDDYEEINAEIHKTHRHDIVRLKGEVFSRPDVAQKHIMVSSIEIIKKFDGGYDGYPEYKHQAQLPQELLDKDSAVVKVHAVANGGKILVVEYKDTNVPVVVTQPELTKDLYRGDKIRIKYTVARIPKKPTHLNLRSDASAVEILDRLVDQHGKPIEQCGTLIMFPKNPQVKFNVFAIQKDIGDDLFRFYTLINFGDVDLFLALRQKAQDFWDAHQNTMTRGRNYYVNSKVTACAKGTVNMVDPTQANPQIIINNINDLYFKTTMSFGLNRHDQVHVKSKR